MLAYNHVAFNQLSKLCPGESKKHRHFLSGITPAEHFATSKETAYPIQSARNVAQCFQHSRGWDDVATKSASRYDFILFYLISFPSSLYPAYSGQLVVRPCLGRLFWCLIIITLVVRPCLQFSLLYHSLSTDRTTAIVVGPCLSSSPTPPYILNTQNNRHCGKTLSIIFLYSFIYHQQAQQPPLW